MNGHRRALRDDRVFRIPTKWVLLGFLAIAGYFLFTEHRAHVIQYLPFLLVLACPLLHMFHSHRGDKGRQHGGAEGGRDGEAQQRERTEAKSR